MELNTLAVGDRGEMDASARKRLLLENADLP
jgi:hypothetical protein